MANGRSEGYTVPPYMPPAAIYCTYTRTAPFEEYRYYINCILALFEIPAGLFLWPVHFSKVYTE